MGKYHEKNHSSTLNFNQRLFEEKPSRRFDVIYSHIRNEIYETKNISQKAGKIHPIFPPISSYATLLPVYSCKVSINS